MHCQRLCALCCDRQVHCWVHCSMIDCAPALLLLYGWCVVASIQPPCPGMSGDILLELLAGASTSVKALY